MDIIHPRKKVIERVVVPSFWIRGLSDLKTKNQQKSKKQQKINPKAYPVQLLDKHRILMQSLDIKHRQSGLEVLRIASESKLLKRAIPELIRARVVQQLEQEAEQSLAVARTELPELAWLHGGDGVLGEVVVLLLVVLIASELLPLILHVALIPGLQLLIGGPLLLDFVDFLLG